MCTLSGFHSFLPAVLYLLPSLVFAALVKVAHDRDSEEFILESVEVALRGKNSHIISLSARLPMARTSRDLMFTVLALMAESEAALRPQQALRARVMYIICNMSTCQCLVVEVVE